MSRTSRTAAERRTLDRYYTPDEVARACVATLPILDGDTVLEPSAGGVAFLRAVRDSFPCSRLRALDLDPASPARLPEYGGFEVEHADFATWSPPPEERIEWVVGNPPYSDAIEHVEAALRVARVGVAFLLRLTFLESVERVSFWRETGATLDEVRVLARRPSFTGAGTDAMAYGWFVWNRRARGPARLVPGWVWREGDGAASRGGGAR
jgi:hypothetical protein